MGKKFVILVASAFLAGTFLFCSESFAKNSGESQNAESTAANDSTDFQKFKKASTDKIDSYEKDIAELKVKISKDEIHGKHKYHKMVADLERKTAHLKKNLNEYREEGMDNWETFKVKFNHRMEHLGKSISNFFSDDK